MIYCKIRDGAVVDCAVFESAMPKDWPDRASWVRSDEAQIGWSYDGKTFSAPPTPPEQPPLVPLSITDRQFAQVLATDNAITWAEAKAWAGAGQLPLVISAAIQTLPANQRQQADYVASTATTFEREHPLFAVLGPALSKSPADIDDIFIRGDQL